MSARPQREESTTSWRLRSETGRRNRSPSSRQTSTSRVSMVSSLPSPEITPLDDEFRDRASSGGPMSGMQDDGPGSNSTSDRDGDDIPEPPFDNDKNITTTTDRAPPRFEEPSIIIGAPFGTGLSAIEQADAEVERWELIYHEIMRAQGPEAVTGIAERLQEAREARRMLDLVEDRDMVENTFIETECFRTQVVAERVGLLREMLQGCANTDTATNIRGVIRSYEDGTVGVSGRYALFWAGHFVDLASSYADFTRDRYDRTARYAEAHGPGSLWFEAPLAPEAETGAGGGRAGGRRGVLAKRGTASGLGRDDHHYVTMSFQAAHHLGLAGCAGRRPGKAGASAWEAAVAKASRFKGRGTVVKEHEGRILVADASKPRLCFSMLLDTGATWPCLLPPDLVALGIKTETYPATSTTATDTANGRVSCWVYELHVAVCDTRSGGSLVDAGDPVWPSRPHMLGGMTPVVALPGMGKGRRPGAVGRLEQNGEVREFLYGEWKKSLNSKIGRLSGLFPLQCCYTQSTPGSRIVWFGEDRRDVLGARRMPGQRRFEPGNTICPPDPEQPRLTGILDRQGEGGDPEVLVMEHVVRNDEGTRILRVRDVETRARGRSELHIADFEGTAQMLAVEPRKRRRLSLDGSGGGGGGGGDNEDDDDYDDDDEAKTRRRAEAQAVLKKLKDEAIFSPGGAWNLGLH